jgi:DNA-binding transcriptional regulator LsrR (DeoR family)
MAQPKSKKPDRAPVLSLDPLVSAAWLYYHLELTQADVAKILGVSRTAVVNLLARAREEGLVTISLDPSHLSTLTLAQEAKALFGLDDVLVVPNSPGASSAAHALGKAGALYLEKTLAPGDILATGWGVTMLELAQALSGKSVPDLTVAQLLGGFSTADSFNPSKIASLMADRLSAKLYHLYLPAVVASPEIRDLLLADPAIRATLEMARAASKAVIGIGKVAPDATIVRAGFVTPVQMDELQAKGAIGDVAARFYDLHGQPVGSSLDERLTGLTLQDLTGIRPIIAVAGGMDKVQAILGALRAGLVNVLITDAATMSEVLARAEESA